MPTLRVLTLALALALALPVFAAPAFAGSGKAIIPSTFTFYTSSNYSMVEIYLSNISGNTVEMTLTLYNEDGTILYETGSSGRTTGDIRAYSVDSYTEATSTATGYTAKAELDSKKSGRFQYYPYVAATGDAKIIFGQIEWKNKYSTDDDTVALVGTANFIRSSTESTRKSGSVSYIPVNNGLPF